MVYRAEKAVLSGGCADRQHCGGGAVGGDSGIYERYFEQDGKRWHHILDPRSGYPLDNELESVTIISADSLDGDIWTTLIYGLGVEKGCAALRQREDIEAIFVTKNRDVILSSQRRFRFQLLDDGYRLSDCTA